MSRAARIEPRFEPRQAETRDISGGYGWGASLGGGPRVSSHLAENLSSVLGAVELICGTLSSLPAAIVQETPDGCEPMPSAAAARLLARPNARQSWPAYMTSVVASILLHGNSISAITTDGRGGVSSLTPVPWSWLNPQVIRGGAGARLVFDIMQNTPESALLNLPARLLDTDVIHIRARSDNGVIGRSVLSRAAGVVSEGLDSAEVARSWWRNGMTLGGALSTDKQLDKPARDRLKDSISDYRGASSAGKVLVLEAGLKFGAITMNAVDAELLASRAFNVGEVARLFSIPEPMLFTGASRLPPTLTPYIAAFASLALAPLVNLIESEFDMILPAGQHLQLDMSGLLRGDYTAVAAAQAVLVQSRIATPNDARRALGLPAHPDGDDLAAGAAPNYPADRPGMPSLAPKPGPGSTLPNVGTHENDGAS